MATEDAASIDRAAALLRAGELVAFPTETVYGLGADARNPRAVARVFAVKGRPADHPLIVHLGTAAQVAEWAREFPQAARRLAAAFWPGPLTIVLPRRPGVLDAVTGGQDTVALRVPAHPVALALLEAFGDGIAAPSANRYGRLSPTAAVHVREELGDRVAMVLDGGHCEVGLESTIVACLEGEVRLLRPGMIGATGVKAVAGQVYLPAARSPRVPGLTRVHYAPATPVELLDAAELDRRCAAPPAGETFAVLARRAAPRGVPGVAWHEAPRAPDDYGHDLYASLRDLDARGASRILVERVPDDEAWAAVRDRLERAAARDPPDGT